MRTHNVCSYGEKTKLILEFSLSDLATFAIKIRALYSILYLCQNVDKSILQHADVPKSCWI